MLSRAHPLVIHFLLSEFTGFSRVRCRTHRGRAKPAPSPTYSMKCLAHRFHSTSINTPVFLSYSVLSESRPLFTTRVYRVHTRGLWLFRLFRSTSTSNLSLYLSTSKVSVYTVQHVLYHLLVVSARVRAHSVFIRTLHGWLVVFLLELIKTRGFLR